MIVFSGISMMSHDSEHVNYHRRKDHHLHRTSLLTFVGVLDEFFSHSRLIFYVLWYSCWLLYGMSITFILTGNHDSELSYYLYDQFKLWNQTTYRFLSTVINKPCLNLDGVNAHDKRCQMSLSKLLADELVLKRLIWFWLTFLYTCRCKL